MEGEGGRLVINEKILTIKPSMVTPAKRENNLQLEQFAQNKKTEDLL